MSSYLAIHLLGRPYLQLVGCRLPIWRKREVRSILTLSLLQLVSLKCIVYCKIGTPETKEGQAHVQYVYLAAHCCYIMVLYR